MLGRLEAVSISRLRPKPLTFLILNPAPSKPRFTTPAQLKVAAVDPGFDKR